MRKLLISALLLLAQTAYSAETELTVFLPKNTSDADISAAEALRDGVSVLSQNELKISIKTGPQYCGTEYACFQALRSGEVDIVSTGINAAARVFPSLVGFDLPYLRQDIASNEGFKNGLRQIIGETGDAHLLAVTVGSQLYVLANSSRRIVTPDDVAGLRIVTHAARSKKKVQILGGVPVRMTGASLSAALQTGEVDGVVLDVSEIMKKGLPMSGLRYATYDGHGSNLRLWWVRRGIRDAVYWSIIEEASLEMALAAHRASIRRNSQSIEDFQAAGGDYTVLRREEQEAFHKRAITQLLQDATTAAGLRNVLNALGIHE